MTLIGLIDEDVVNYQITSLYLAFPYCSFKCDLECGRPVCQNSSLARSPRIEIEKEKLCERYVNNPLTRAVVCGGLEPFDSDMDLVTFVDCLRRKYECSDDIVIYTGYTEEELEDTQNARIHAAYENLKQFKNIIIKYGRFVPDSESRVDPLLGVTLASNNQYAKRLINESSVK